MTLEPSVGRGRPRLIDQRRTGGSPREEILDAAGELFTTRGYSGTSTRLIGEAVGMRQASLYHHFDTKEAILEALLQDTVAPTLEFADGLDPTAPASERLADLVRFDAGQLAASRWNLGALYLLPEINSERFDSFRRVRFALADVYQQLAAQVVGDPHDGRITLPFRLVESIISMRYDGELGDPEGPGSATARAAVVEVLVTAIERILA